jgi:hypothetical protein
MTSEVVINGTVAGDYDVSVQFDGGVIMVRRIKVVPGNIDNDKCSIACLKFIRPDIKSPAKAANPAGKRFLVVLRDRFWNVLTNRTVTASVVSVEPGMDHHQVQLCCEHLGLPFSVDHNDRADYKPSELESISESIRKVGLRHCRTAALQMGKERKLIKKLLKPTPTEYWEHPESVIKRLVRCPIVNEKTHLNLEYLSVPHPGTSKLRMDQVFLLSKRPLRGVASVEEKIGGEKTEEQGEKRGNGEKGKIGANRGGGRPSVLLDRNTHIWFPFINGHYELNLQIANRTLSEMQERKEGKENDVVKKSTLSLPFEVSLIRGGAFGSIEWILQHKILRKDVFHWRYVNTHLFAHRNIWLATSGLQHLALTF